MLSGRLVRIGMTMVASAALVATMGGSASASGPTVRVEKAWGKGTFKPGGEHVWVRDKRADGYSVHAKLQQWSRISRDDIWFWVDFRDGCWDTTSTGDPGRHCNYSFGENKKIRVCITRKRDGDRHGDWYCSSATRS